MEPMDPEVPHVHDDGEIHAHPPVENGQYDIPAPGEPMDCEVAFLVIIRPDGTATGIGDINTPVRPQRQATLNDMYGAAAQVMKDVAIMQGAQMTANAVLQGQMQIAAQAQQAMQDQKLAQQIMMPNRTQRRQH